MLSLNLKPNSTIIIQGIEQPLAIEYLSTMQDYGTKIVAGISTGKAGETFTSIPIFNLVEEAKEEFGIIDISLIFVPPLDILDACLEAIASGIKFLIIVTSDIPPLDSIKLMRKAKQTNTIVLGSGQGGLLIPETLLLGTIDPQFFTLGKVGIISRCPDLTHEIAYELTSNGIGQSKVINLGTDLMLGTDFNYWLNLLENDANTESILLIGHFTGNYENLAGDFIPGHITKPIFGYFPSQQLPLEKTFADVNAVISAQLSSPVNEPTSFKEKLDRLQQAKVKLIQRPSELVSLLQ